MRRGIIQRWLASILTVVILMAPSMSAVACSVMRSPTQAERFEGAKAVFLARIVRTEEKIDRAPQSPLRGIPSVEARYELIEVFKGHPAPDGVVRDGVFGPGNCSLGLLAGWYYVFFVSDDEAYVGWPTGSIVLQWFGPNDPQTQSVVSELRALAKR